MPNAVVNRFFGGSPLAVLLRLHLAVRPGRHHPDALGFDPGNIIESIRRMVGGVWNMGFDAVRWLWRYFLLGAIVVIPIWLLVRFLRTPAVTDSASRNRVTAIRQIDWRASADALLVALRMNTHRSAHALHRHPRARVRDRGPDDLSSATTPLLGVVATGGDRTARRGASARRGRDVVGGVRLPVLAVRVPAHGHGGADRAGARRRRRRGRARDLVPRAAGRSKSSAWR